MFRDNVLKLNHHLCLCALILSSTILACSEQELDDSGSENTAQNDGITNIYDDSLDQGVGDEPAIVPATDSEMESEPDEALADESCEAVVYMGYTLCLNTNIDSETVVGPDTSRSESCLTPEQMVESLENTLREQHPEAVDEDGNLIVKVNCTDADQDCYYECEGWDLGTRQDPDDRRASIPGNPNLNTQPDDTNCLTVNDGEKEI